MSHVLSGLLDARTVVIFRGMAADRGVTVAEVMYEAGLRAFEVTLNSAGALRLISAMRKALPEDALIGAGTVVGPDEVRPAADAGASYVISPNVDPAVVRATKAAGLVSIPGAYTATEILQAHAAGADIVKVFPVEPAGPVYIRQIRGPVPQVRLLASGGVDASLAPDYFAAGCDMIGTGHQLFGGGAVAREDWDAVRADARRFVEAGRAAQRAADDPKP